MAVYFSNEPPHGATMNKNQCNEVARGSLAFYAILNDKSLLLSLKYQRAISGGGDSSGKKA